MNRVWRIGSRWSDIGSWESRIFKVFRRNGVVFTGSSSASRMKEVKEGDYFAVADGLRIIAIAKALSTARSLQEMIDCGRIRIRKEDFFQADDDYSGWCYAVNVKFVDLDKDSCFDCWPCQAFCEIKDNIIKKKVISLYDSGFDKKFDISAKTCRIFNTQIKDDKSSIISPIFSYVIPIYQREYSWGESQIENFIRDIFKGFWGAEDNRNLILDPMFIGTMQLSDKTVDNECDVIDGQQRLSTVLCIIKYLQLRFPNDSTINNVPINWLSTRVNNGKEQGYLDAMIALDSLNCLQSLDDYSSNRYLRNLEIISEVFDENIINEDGTINKVFSSNLSVFINYFLSNILFVVVETKAGLSKTLQIFNTINTAGLDLGSTDLFKIHLYEYLRDRGAQEQTFDEISAVYRRIKDINTEWKKNHNWDLVSLNGLLSIYQNYLIAKYNLNINLFSMATDTFFECLFDVLLKVREHKDKHFTNLNNLSLSINDLDRIIDVMNFWNSAEYQNTSQFLSYNMIEWTRYSRHNNIAYLILLREDCSGSTEQRLKKVFGFLYYFSRFFFMANIDAARVVYGINSFGYEMYRKVINEPWEVCMKTVIKKVQDWSDTTLRRDLSQDIFQRRLWANSVCCLSACLDEIEIKPNITYKELEEKLNKQFDLEHIHSRNDVDFDFEDYELLNSIGNLMLLEGHINKSIGNIPFKEKVNRSDGNVCYKDSCYACVEKVRKKDDWKETDAASRRENEIKKISEFLKIKDS